MRFGHISTCKLLLSQDHVVVNHPSHYPPGSDGKLSLAVVRLWAMWDEGRLPEFSEAEEREHQAEVELWPFWETLTSLKLEHWIHQRFL